MSNKTFIHDNFLLETTHAQELYHDYVKDQPIIDYHNHLPPEQILVNHQFENITQAWIGGDHYKWRAMRTLGIDESFVTGSASDYDKFLKWASAVPNTIRNPLFHWTHLELARYFDVNQLLNEHTAPAIYEKTKDLLQTEDYGARGLLQKMNVEAVCTTEDPIDTLEHHKAYSYSNQVKMSTAYRPDKAILITSKAYIEYLELLSEVSGVVINSFSTLCDALKNRMDYFHTNGCRLSDHGLGFLYFKRASESELNKIFNKRKENKEISIEETAKFQTELLLFLSESYAKRGWVQQFHLGVLRNNNERMHNKLGPDTGGDSIGDFSQATNLSSFLNTLDKNDLLTKTILYNLNPADNEVFATMTGNFNDGSIKGKVQWGSAWWFMDQKEGMTKQINTLSNMGVLSTFVGMLTDSRSFLSFPRHEYFRRILCNILGNDIQKGDLPDDKAWIGKIAQDIAYTNAKEYFKF